MTHLQALLTQRFPDLKFKFNFPLAKVTYFKIGGPAEVWLELADRPSVLAVLEFCREQQLPYQLIGGASNVLVPDEGVTGLVLRINFNHCEKIGPDSTDPTLTILRAGCGCSMPSLVRTALKLNLTGLEYFLGVPGTVGGAIFNNAHYLQHLIGDHVSQVEVLTPTGEVQWLPQSKCDFSYDHSRFHTSQEIIFQVDFKLKTGSHQESVALIQAATDYRTQTQPLTLPSSGCIFRNVPNTAALTKLFPQFAGKNLVPGGFLIDQAGLKGARQGDIQVSEKHAAFMVNLGHGTARDLLILIEQVKKTVKAKFGVDLQEEVFWLY